MEIWPESGYISRMSSHSVVEAKNQLSALIEKALKGERVVITRHGQPVVELSPVREAAPRRSGKEAVEWLRERAIIPLKPGESAGELVSKLRDEWDRRRSISTRTSSFR